MVNIMLIFAVIFAQRPRMAIPLLLNNHSAKLQHLPNAETWKQFSLPTFRVTW
jgi:hypothetical protein